jgi:hypothetical protein
MLSCCTESPYKEKLCRACWRAKKEMQYHCTWPNCIRPVFALTLCRSHYRQINVECVHAQCHRPSYCRQVCAHHYRKKQFLPVVTCSECTRPTYMDQKCFYHFTYRSCLQCQGTVFSKQLCRKHYMRQYRLQRLAVKGPITNNETRPDASNIVPETMNHSPESHSSFEHSVISERLDEFK